MLFGVNEKILCFHVGLLYEAKVLKAEKWTGDDNLTKAVGPHYFVHYMGWRARWDEWVPESRMLKLNEDNIQKQKALADSVKAAREAKLYESSSSNSKPSARKSGGSVTAGMNGTTTSHGRESSETHDSSDRRKAKESRGTKRGRDAVEQVSYCSFLLLISILSKPKADKDDFFHVGGRVYKETRNQADDPRYAQGTIGRRLGIHY